MYTAIAAISALVSLSCLISFSLGFYLARSEQDRALSRSPSKGTTHAVSPAIARKLIRSGVESQDSIKIISPRKKAANQLVME